MKRYLLMALFIVAGFMAFANSLPPIINQAEREKMMEECKFAPMLAQEWKTYSLGSADMSSVTNTYVYDGTAKTPTPKVKMNGVELVAGTNFVYSYTNNVNSGWATVSVTALGESLHGGQCVKYFISPAQLSNVTVSNIASQVYTGSPVCPVPVIVDGSTPLVLNRDFAVTWANNVNPSTNAVCRILGLRNYRGNLRVNFTIADAQE